jgi:hypothetical protein
LRLNAVVFEDTNSVTGDEAKGEQSVGEPDATGPRLGKCQLASSIDHRYPLCVQFCGLCHESPDVHLHSLICRWIARRPGRSISAVQIVAHPVGLLAWGHGERTSDTG